MLGSCAGVSSGVLRAHLWAHSGDLRIRLGGTQGRRLGVPASCLPVSSPGLVDAVVGLLLYALWCHIAAFGLILRRLIFSTWQPIERAWTGAGEGAGATQPVAAVASAAAAPSPFEIVPAF